MAFENASSLALMGFSLISISLIFVTIAFLALTWKRYRLHKYCMGSAIFTNSLFLVFYLIRLFTEGNTHFPGPNWFLYSIYLPVLITHIFTAILSIWFVLRQFWSGFKGQSNSLNGQLVLTGDYRKTHRQNGYKALAIWSISFVGGISVFLMLYVLF